MGIRFFLIKRQKANVVLVIAEASNTITIAHIYFSKPLRVSNKLVLCINHISDFPFTLIQYS